MSGSFLMLIFTLDRIRIRVSANYLFTLSSFREAVFRICTGIVLCGSRFRFLVTLFFLSTWIRIQKVLEYRTFPIRIRNTVTVSISYPNLAKQSCSLFSVTLIKLLTVPVRSVVEPEPTGAEVFISGSRSRFKI